MTGSEAERWETGVDVGEAVVVVGDLQLSGVLISVAVGVADERSLPLNIAVLSANNPLLVTGVTFNKTYVVVELVP